MPTTIVTIEDLMEFKLELLKEIKKLLNNQSGSHPSEFQDQWKPALHQDRWEHLL
jgi:hypothetical protein